jgi:hypothetical protein
MSQPALRIVSDEELPPHKRRVALAPDWRTRPSTLRLGAPQVPAG